MGQSRATGIKLLSLSGSLFYLSFKIFSVEEPRSSPLVLLPLSVVPVVILMMVRYVAQRLA